MFMYTYVLRYIYIYTYIPDASRLQRSAIRDSMPWRSNACG